jgi:dienelactone hydrolase
MHRSLTAAAAIGLALMAGAARAEPLTGTSGPYPVVMEADPSLPGYAVFRPADLKAVKGKAAFVAFGNGGCFNMGNAFQNLLGEVASQGFVVTAPGPILAAPPARISGAPPAQSKPGQMVAAIDWAQAQARIKGSLYNGRLDTGRVAVMGQSCGGLEAIAAGGDARVTTVVVLNSGIIRGGIPNPDGSTRQPSGYLPASEADLPKLHTPVIYVIGGPKDQAWRGAEGDFAQIEKVPVFNANIDKGHGGTWREPGGGVMAVPAIAWLKWRLNGDKQAGKLFAGPDCGLCKDPAWTVKKKNMN